MLGLLKLEKRWMPKSMLRRFVVYGELLFLLVLGVFYGYRLWLCGPGMLINPFSVRTADYDLASGEHAPVQVADLLSTTTFDFPEFLGPRLKLFVDNVQLNPDWEKFPPKEVWRQPIGAGWSSFSVVNGYAVTMEQRGDAEQVTCYDVLTGKPCWVVSWDARFLTAGVGPRSTPTIEGGRVYALGAWGHLVCIDGNSGNVIWEREILDDLGITRDHDHKMLRYGRSNSPLRYKNLVIVPGGGAEGSRFSLLAYNALTGEPAWRGGDQQVSFASPIAVELLGTTQILTVNESSVAGHDPETGAELWSYPWPGRSRLDACVSQPVPISANRILLTKGYRRGAAMIELDINDKGIEASLVWEQRKTLLTKFTNVVIMENHAYGLSEGVLECMNLDGGMSCWKEGRYGHGQILRVGDLLLVISDKGTLSLVSPDPETPNNVLGSLQALNARTWNNLALYGRYLLVRNAEEAVCYQLEILKEADDDYVER